MKNSSSAFLRKPIAITPSPSDFSPMPALKEGIQSPSGGPYAKAILVAPSPLKMKDSSSSSRSLQSMDYNEEKSPVLQSPSPLDSHSQRSFSNVLSVPQKKSFEGENPLVLSYNPKNCVLSQDVVDKLEYKKELIEILCCRLNNYNMKKPNDAIKKKFISYCRM
eukprot:UN12033